MKLQDINKRRYRKHLNILLVVLCVSLIAMALLFGQLFIALFSEGQGSNFSFNLAGVVMAGLACLAFLYTVRHHDFMLEVYYIWQLKQGLNKIYRKLKAIEAAADDDNIDAIIILNYYYTASSQLFKLDDNTITLDSLQLQIDKINSRIATKNLTIKLEDYDASMLAKF
ncbi:MAG: DUF3087 family protein [Pseudomonadales bacterium]|nr:DUF3087 family protein [Pseudomonadales bacterium]